MKKLTVLNKSILTALCVALCVVLPMTLHAIPKGGVLFSPMHLPVLLCGLVCGAPFGLVCGILGPLVSSLLTGMPVFGYMPVMMIELGLYGLISGLVMQFLRSGKLVVDLYAALVIAMLGGRVITGILRALIFAGGSIGTKVGAGLASAVITGLLSSSGYVSSSAGITAQPETALEMIVSLYKFGPILIAAVIIVTLFGYKLDKMYPAIMQELTEREAHGQL